jgi:hypothetical protein
MVIGSTLERASGLVRRRVALIVAVVAMLTVSAVVYGQLGAPPAVPGFGETVKEFDSSAATGPALGAPQVGAFPSMLPAEGAARASSFALSEAPLPDLAPAGGAADLLGRQIIRTGSMDIEVDSVADTFERVSAIAAAAGGFVADSSFFGRGEQQSAQMTLRVPAEQFEVVLNELRTIAVEVTSISTSAQDVTGELTDLDSQLRNLRAVEAQYLDLLQRARNVGEILQVQDRLNQTRAQIDRTEGRIQLLGRLSDLATLSVTLRPVPAPPVEISGGGPLAAAGEAWEASLRTLSAIATVAVTVVVYSWWLLPPLAIAMLAGRRLLQRWPGQRAPQPID